MRKRKSLLIDRVGISVNSIKVSIRVSINFWFSPAETGTIGISFPNLVLLKTFLIPSIFFARTAYKLSCGSKSILFSTTIIFDINISPKSKMVSLKYELPIMIHSAV